MSVEVSSPPQTHEWSPPMGSVSFSNNRLPSRRSGPASHTLFWNSYALGYDFTWESPVTAASAEIVAHELAVGDIVDLGCGTGLFSAELMVRGANIIGVDRSAAMLKQAVRKGRITSSLCCDAANTGLADSCADSVVCANVLHLHSDPSGVLSESLRLVRAGGRIAIATPTDQATHDQVLREDRAADRGFWRAVSANFFRHHIAMLARASGVKINHPDLIVNTIRGTIAAHQLELVVERFVGRTQWVVILERRQ